MTLFQSHSETSRAAAESMTTADTLRAAVYQFIKGKGGYGSTDEEAQNFLNMPGSTQRPRRVELEMAGLVRDSGIRRATASGRRAVVWVVTEANQ